MKISLLVLLPLVASAVPSLAQDSLPTPPKFNWKLRLTRGQKWTQTLTVRSHSVQQSPAMPGIKTSKLDLDTTQTIGFKNEVVDVTPTYYLLRTTYTQMKTETSIKIDGKPQKLPAQSQPQPDFVGVSFMVKQAPDGRVLDVTGLEALVARQKKMMDALTKDPAMRAMFGSLLPSIDSFKQSISRTKSLALARKPLAVGESYSYGVSIPILGSLNFSINGKRTLLSFDDQTAVFDEGGTFAVPPTQMFGPTEKRVTLTGDAAQLYMARKYHASTASPQPTYLSKNGRIYYREANNPSHVIWLDPPAGGIQLSESEAAPYRDIRGFNGQTTGNTLDYYYPSPTTTSARPSAPDRARPTPIAGFALPKTFVTMSGTLTGKSTVDAVTGLTIQSNITQTIQGKVTVVDATGRKQSISLTATSQNTSLVQKG